MGPGWVWGRLVWPCPCRPRCWALGGHASLGARRSLCSDHGKKGPLGRSSARQRGADSRAALGEGEMRTGERGSPERTAVNSSAFGWKCMADMEQALSSASATRQPVSARPASSSAAQGGGAARAAGDQFAGGWAEGCTGFHSRAETARSRLPPQDRVQGSSCPAPLTNACAHAGTAACANSRTHRATAAAASRTHSPHQPGP